MKRKVSHLTWVMGILTAVLILASAVAFIVTEKSMQATTQPNPVPQSEPPFAISIINFVQGAKRDNCLIFCQYNLTVLSPVPVILLITITNRQPHQAMIGAFTVVVQSEKTSQLGKPRWIRMVRVPDELPLVWMNKPPHPSLQVTIFSKRLMPQITGRSLEPHEAVVGCVLLDAPKEFDEVPMPKEYRISLSDTEGHEYSVVDSGPEHPEANIDTLIGIHTGGAVDIRGFKIEHFADLSPQ